MIKINNLTKIYKTRKRNRCKALDNINLTLPNEGLVFVLGKSGSGKSTLLNLIGGLDNISQGSIIVDGNDISNFKEHQLCNYRNNHIGFVYQDYHLIEELTVYENIVIALNLIEQEDNERVKEALKRVELEGYENRYPRELSGGERQRVAIARAIIKKPHIILADEPTGNLDNLTATAIISLLKDLSKDCLILIVSHNTNDTYKYADRIIELSKGKIIEDRSKNLDYKEDVFLLENIIYYPNDRILNDKDIELINENKDKQIIKINDKYHPTTIKDIKTEKIEIENKKLSIKESIKLSLKFLKSKLFRISLSSFITSAIVVILGLSLTIVTFDNNQVISNELKNVNTTDVLFKKTDSKDPLYNHDKNYILDIEEGDIESFYNNGYEGNVYKLYVGSLFINSNELNNGKVSSLLTTSSPYIVQTGGTLVCTKEFVEDRLGGFELIYESDVYEKGGFYITDYAADSILYYKNSVYKNYKDIVGTNYWPSSNGYGYINGIIKTNYKEKFSDVLKNFVNLNSSNIKEYITTNEYQEFYNYVTYYLSVHYSFEKDFEKHFENSFYRTWVGTLQNMDIHYNGNTYELKDKYINYRDVLDIGDNSGAFNYLTYNELFNTNYTLSNLDTFKPHYVTIDFYRRGDVDKKDLKISLDIYIEKLVKSKNDGFIYLGDALFYELSKLDIFPYAIYFDDLSGISNLTKTAEENGYTLESYFAKGLLTMTSAVDAFIPIFRLIAIILCSGIVLILINFSVKMIKDKYHDIGILKAIGTSNNTIAIVFGLQIGLIALLTIIVSTIGYLLFIDLANTVLIASLRELAKSMIVLDLKFLTFKGMVVLINSLLVVLLTAISLIAPLLKIRSIKPVKIIKTKE